ncbi:MAG: hypothetical protein WHS65_07535 [Melioribacteraceae bacterium]
METSQEKNKRNIKIITWVIIVISSLSLLASLSSLIGSLFMNTAQNRIYSSAANAKMNMNLVYVLIMNSIQFLLSAFLLISAIFALQFKEYWRGKIILGLILSIVYLLIAPIINFYYPPVEFQNQEVQNLSSNVKMLMLYTSYFYSIVVSIFFIISIFRYSNKNIKILFE